MKGICRKNISTCCTKKEIFSTHENFTLGQKQLYRNYELLLEIITIFRGQDHIDLLFHINNTDLKDKCFKYIFDSPYFPKI